VPPRRAALPKTILEAETPYRVADVATTDVSLGWHGNAVLVHRDLDIRGIARLPLPGLEPAAPSASMSKESSVLSR
jgi:hypothetical protein